MLRPGRARIVVTMLTSVWLTTSALAAAPHHSVGGSLDLGVHAVRDDALVPLTHTGARVALSPQYGIDLDLGLLLADGRFGMAYVLGNAGEEGLTSIWGLHATPRRARTSNRTSARTASASPTATTGGSSLTSAMPCGATAASSCW